MTTCSVLSRISCLVGKLFGVLAQSRVGGVWGHPPLENFLNFTLPEMQSGAI